MPARVSIRSKLGATRAGPSKNQPNSPRPTRRGDTMGHFNPAVNATSPWNRGGTEDHSTIASDSSPTVENTDHPTT